MRTRRREQEDFSRQLADAQARIAELHRALVARDDVDVLTELPNLRRFRTQLDIECKRARRHGRALTIALLDLDGFRTLNAKHGFMAGDDALSATAKILRTFTRAHDLCARSGPDEFAVMMPETDPAGAMACFERILLELEVVEAGPVNGLSASVGIAACSREHTPAQALRASSTALDRARAMGGGRAAVADEPREAKSEAQRDAVSALAVALLERDRYTGEHSESLVEMAAAVASGLGLNADEVDRVRAAALLHDVGKVGIPDEVLQKTGPLDENQWAMMREHPLIGERILRVIPGMGGVARIVRHEHERWDGAGYPDKLAGEEIPIGSRIILACDAYHAMTTDRPYRKAMTHAQAVDELLDGAGAQFDPDVTEALIGYLYGARQAGVTTATS
jgi:diguanylate cyclase (GGDEF)-like protein